MSLDEERKLFAIANKEAFSNDILRLKENLPEMLRFEAIKAKLTRAKYLSLIQEGFDEKQAIELCKEGK